MPGAGTSSGSRVIGETVIKDGKGNLLVQFSSLDAETIWGQRFEAARIKYCMLKRRERIPKFLRTGKCFFLVKIIMTIILERKLKRR